MGGGITRVSARINKKEDIRNKSSTDSSTIEIGDSLSTIFTVTYHTLAHFFLRLPWGELLLHSLLSQSLRNALVWFSTH